MEFSFVIPRNNKDLLDADVSGYYVKQVYNPNELSQHIRGEVTFRYLKYYYAFGNRSFS